MRRTREELYRLAEASERMFQEAEAKRKKEAAQEVEHFNEDWVLLNTGPVLVMAPSACAKGPLPRPSRQRCNRTGAPSGSMPGGTYRSILISRSRSSSASESSGRKQTR